MGPGTATKGMNVCPSPHPNTYWLAPSRKKLRFSGRKRKARDLPRVDLRFGKSVFTVTTVTSWGVIFHVKSRPSDPCQARGEVEKLSFIRPTKKGLTSVPAPCRRSPSPVTDPALLTSHSRESKVGEAQRKVILPARGRYRSRFRPHWLSPGVKLSVREGMTISADQPSVVRAVRASQMPSES
jgi:hypothetical protein